jgi:hypothetical protein
MQIVAIETINVEAFSNLVWVQIHTDDGLSAGRNISFAGGDCLSA